MLTETRLASHFPPTGSSDGQRQFAGRQWRWQLDVQATDVATIRRLQVRVYDAEDRNTPVAEINGFSGEELQP